MSENISQDELKGRVLEALYRHAQSGDRSISAEEAGTLIEGNFGLQRLEMALQSLVSNEFARASYVMNSPTKYRISEAGYYEVERAVFNRLEEVEERSSDPLATLEQRLIPASDRMVGFGDNQSDADEALAAIEDVSEAIRTSNSLDEALRDETLASVASWKGMVEKGRNFAVGAFRFLVWNRIKAVIEGGIEDAYRYILVGGLLTLGTLILGLL
ncbi:hypothetical protein GRI69_09000 [Erythrobacter vulgaris]|uniref:Uncharacterized protein n=1 Tax=Qipengyuania vulgaris TaxID=291985 RepID=A0A844XTD6_9SPHN|nr:hypothetical protein [Qipengyuania vulgaris]MXO48393.1 hypothetical protein [Qipengyuania vulgaris]